MGASAARAKRGGECFITANKIPHFSYIIQPYGHGFFAFRVAFDSSYKAAKRSRGMRIVDTPAIKYGDGGTRPRRRPMGGETRRLENQRRRGVRSKTYSILNPSVRRFCPAGEAAGSKFNDDPIIDLHIRTLFKRPVPLPYIRSVASQYDEKSVSSPSWP